MRYQTQRSPRSRGGDAPRLPDHADRAFVSGPLRWAGSSFRRCARSAQVRGGLSGSAGIALPEGVSPSGSRAVSFSAGGLIFSRAYGGTKPKRIPCNRGSSLFHRVSVIFAIAPPLVLFSPGIGAGTDALRARLSARVRSRQKTRQGRLGVPPRRTGSPSELARDSCWHGACTCDAQRRTSTGRESAERERERDE